MTSPGRLFHPVGRGAQMRAECRRLSTDCTCRGLLTEASIRTALQKGDMGLRKVAVQFGVATGTVQRIAREVGASVVA